MATATGVSLAIGILVDAGMLPGIVDAEGGKRRIRAWMTLLDQDMTDEVLAEAVRRVASGDVETYGAAKPQHVNRAAKAVRGERIRAWRERHSLPTEGRSGFEQSAYLRGFLRAIGNGAADVDADRHGRASLAQAVQVAELEPSTPLPEVLARMDHALGAGRVPWADALPAARPVAELTAAPSPESSGDGAARAREVLAALARSSHPGGGGRAGNALNRTRKAPRAA